MKTGGKTKLREAEQFCGKALPQENDLTILFGSMDGDDGTMLCVGGIGDTTPTHGGSEKNLAPMLENNADWSEDNIGRSSVGRVAQRTGNEVMVDSPLPKKSKSMEYYVERIYESMLERSRNEKNAMRCEQEVTELWQLVEEHGVSQGSKLYFIATELFSSPTRRATFRCINTPEH
uniref:Uncharacterized protein n=1 Tax=Arundo donax TaxID=35708 RepID=A0A0A9R3T0_ARUDO